MCNSLANDKTSFAQLFDLLSVPDPDITLAAWDFLKKLPTNEDLRKSIHSLGGYLNADSSSEAVGVDWIRLLDAGSHLKLLYSLKIVADILAGKVSSAEVEQWEAAGLIKPAPKPADAANTTADSGDSANVSDSTTGAVSNDTVTASEPNTETATPATLKIVDPDSDVPPSPDPEPEPASPTNSVIMSTDTPTATTYDEMVELDAQTSVQNTKGPKIVPASDSKGTSAANKQKCIEAWFAKVLAAGGLEHLQSILKGLDIEACLASVLGTNCLALLLNLLQHLLKMRKDNKDIASIGA